MRGMETVYVCNRCGEAFPIEDSYVQRYEEGDILLCPNCRSDDIEEGARCRVCREIHPTYELEYGICKDCFNDAVAAYKSCLNSLMPWEREVLECEYGNIDVTEKEA